MNFQQLRSVREAIRRDFSLTEVANALFTSQPGVSRQIRELEEELGVEIFERSGKRLVGLTAPGTEILRIVERLLLEADNLKRAGHEFSTIGEGRLLVATTHTQARYALPPVIAQFRRAYPQVKLRLHQSAPEHIVAMLEAGEADIGIATESLAGRPGLAALPAYRWHHAVIAPRGHPIAAAAPLTLAELAQHPLVTYDPGYTGRSRIDEAFERAGLTPDFTLTALDADVIKTYVEQGLGVGIVASMAIDPQRDTGLVALDASHLFAANTTRIAVRRGAYLRSYTYRFIELLAPHLDQAVVTDAMDGILPSDEDLLADERAAAAGAFANAESFVRAGAVSA